MIVTNVMLKLIVLHDTAYQHITSRTVLHVCAASVLEHVSFMAATALSLYCVQGTRSLVFSRQNKLRYKIYLYLALPELLKLLLVVLQIFDSEASLLILVGLLLLSVQHTALESLLGTASQRHLVLGGCVAVLVRVAVKRCFYSTYDVYLSGVIV